MLIMSPPGPPGLPKKPCLPYVPLLGLEEGEGGRRKEKTWWSHVSEQILPLVLGLFDTRSLHPPHSPILIKLFVDIERKKPA